MFRNTAVFAVAWATTAPAVLLAGLFGQQNMGETTMLPKMSDSYAQSDPSALPVNKLAAAYQPRRVWAAAVSIIWNLFLAISLLASHGEWSFYHRLAYYVREVHVSSVRWIGPAYIALLFIAYSALNYPVDLWFGYLEERQFGLAKDGIRAWTRDWLIGVAQHGFFFVTGSSLLLWLQAAFPALWLLWLGFLLLALFILTSYFAPLLLPRGLFQLEPIEPADNQRLANLIRGCVSAASGQPVSQAQTILPPTFIFSVPDPRDFCGGLMGLGDRQVLLISRSSLTTASDSLLRFVLLHDLGHRRYHHLLISTLAGWTWVMIGMCLSQNVIGRWSPESMGHAPFIAWLALLISLWMALGEPVLAYLGRRLEYQADRFYLRCGGNLAEMRIALEELSSRNHARTEGLRRRDTIFHPLPSVWNRLHAASQYTQPAAPSTGGKEVGTEC